MPMLMKYEHLCFYLIPSANRGTNKGFLDSCHYNFPYKNVITIHFIGKLPLQFYIPLIHALIYACYHLGPLSGAEFAYWPVLPLFHLLRQRREAAPT